MRKFLLFCTTTFAMSFATYAQGGNNNGTIDGLEEMVSRQQYMVPMHDGTLLATDVFLPIFQDDLRLPLTIPVINVTDTFTVARKGTQYFYYPNQQDPWKLPILFTRTPYNKSDPIQGQIEGLMGYCAVVQDMRGRYSSHGTYLPMYSDSWAKTPYINSLAPGHPLDTTPTKEANDHEDGYESIQYFISNLRRDTDGDNQITANDSLICNGNIGMFGASALGNSQYQAAGAHKIDPTQPGLKCLFPIVASAEHYYTTGHHNGVYRERIIDGWLRGQVERYNFLDDSTDTDVKNGVHSLQDFGPGIGSPRLAAEACIDFWTVQGKSHYPWGLCRPVMDMSYAPVNASGQGDINGNVSRYTFMDLPIYHLTGWWDIFTDGQIRTWQYCKKEIPSKNRDYQKLVIGPWAHQTIGSKKTGDMQYKENVGDVMGATLDDINPSAVGSIANSELISYYRKFLGDPMMILPPSGVYQNVGIGEVMVPGDTFTTEFHNFFNFINGTGPLQNFPIKVKILGNESIQYVDIPATGQSFIGDTSGAVMSSPQNINWDGSASNGIKNVRCYMVGPNNDGIDGVGSNPAVGNYWMHLDTFPVHHMTRPVNFYFHANHTIDTIAPVTNEGQLTYFNDPNSPVITHGGNNMIVRTPDGTRDSQGQMNFLDPLYKDLLIDTLRMLTFTTPEVSDSFAIVGFPSCKLYAKTIPQGSQLQDVANCDFVVRVLDVYPNGGGEYFVFEGAVNTNARKFAKAWKEDKWMISNEAIDTIPWANVKSDSVYEFEFQMLPIAYTWGKGHQMKVIVSSSNYPRYQSNPQIPLQDGEFFRRRPFEDKTYTYEGITMYSRPSYQTLTFDPNMPSAITFPVLGGRITSTDDNALTEKSLQMFVYPNPANDVLMVSVNHTTELTLEIKNLVGQTLIQERFRNQKSVDVKNLSQGIYILEVSSPDGKVRKAQKIVVE